MRYLIKAVTLDSRTGEVVHGSATDRFGVVESEIDTATNPIFAECDGPWSVEDMFETYWNRLNERDEFERKSHIVKAINVTRVLR